jgi:REP element-mobilizing transposase RayT
MSNYRRANTKGGTYFFTVITYRRQKILCNDEIRIALREGIQHVQKTHLFTIDVKELVQELIAYCEKAILVRISANFHRIEKLFAENNQKISPSPSLLKRGAKLY